MIDTFFLAKSFVTLLVITDPVGTVPIFLAITADWSARQRNQAAWQAVAVATLVIATFALFGQQILIYLGISVPSLQIAGGLLLLVVALDLLRGELASLTGEARSNVAFVPLGTPLLAGPGAIAAAGKPVRDGRSSRCRLGSTLRASAASAWSGAPGSRPGTCAPWPPVVVPRNRWTPGRAWLEARLITGNSMEVIQPA